MTDENLNIPLFEQYEIEHEKYKDVSVSILPLSVRIINRLFRNNITTLDKLLMLTTDELISLNGFGKNCFSEVKTFCKSLSDEGGCTIETPSLFKKNTLSNKQNMPNIDIFKKYKNDIAFGDFSSLENCELTEVEKEILHKYKDGYDLLGSDIVFDCICILIFVCTDIKVSITQREVNVCSIWY